MTDKVSIYENEPEITMGGIVNPMPPPQVPSSAYATTPTASASFIGVPLTVTERISLPDGSTSVKITTSTSHADGYKSIKIECYSIPSSVTYDEETGDAPSRSYLTKVVEHSLPPGTVFESSLDETLLHPSIEATNNGNNGNNHNNDEIGASNTTGGEVVTLPQGSNETTTMPCTHPAIQDVHRKWKCVMLAGVLIFILMLIGMGSLYYGDWE